MSVTFEPSRPEAESWQVQCACGATSLPTLYPARDDALDARALIAPCGDYLCDSFTPAVRAHWSEEAPSINLSNINARSVLDALGLNVDEDGEHSDLSGHVTADDMLGRVLIAMAVAPVDAGRPVTTSGIVMDMGRSEGHVQGRLVELHEISEWARARDLVVQWA